MAFTADWLSLREPADRFARNPELLHHAVKLAGSNPVVVDLGCGTGSTVRQMSPLLPKGSSWWLVDNDESLLELAHVAAGGSGMTYLTDITSVDSLPLDGASLVTASALLDLVTERWLEQFVTRLKVPFYAALTYDGHMAWDPPAPDDEAITQAFNRHQRGDKGLGPALGPIAAAATEAIFSAAGWTVHTAPSPWQLDGSDKHLQEALVEGIGVAAGEAEAESADEWVSRRVGSAATTRCTIGHIDLLAIPPGHSIGGGHGHD